MDQIVIQSFESLGRLRIGEVEQGGKYGEHASPKAVINNEQVIEQERACHRSREQQSTEATLKWGMARCQGVLPNLQGVDHEDG